MPEIINRNLQRLFGTRIFARKKVFGEERGLLAELPIGQFGSFGSTPPRHPCVSAFPALGFGVRGRAPMLRA